MAAPDTRDRLNAFLERFETFVRVDFSCKQLDDENPHQFADTIRQQTQALCETIVSKAGGTAEVWLWPTLLTTCEADASISRQAGQDRGTYLLGIRGDLERDSVEGLLHSWRADVRMSTVFVDYLPAPCLSTHLVAKEDLGLLAVDIWMCPQLLDGQIMILSASHNAREDTGIAHAVTGKPAPVRAGSSAAEAAARRSPSPGTKKLTPAAAILNRLKWDHAFDSTDYVVVYEDRHEGLMESPVDSWTTESTEETFVPMHRIRSIKRKSTGMIVWHREERIDLISSRVQ
ncbi:uncharacterized protein PV09_00342 [Verruconis gallopava]|uniref:MJ1316 RNA cyclic group end recognition domain-containing protein n=1 Tax=Verruconis gallopava TaxID=253628 RepID=A0A0D1Z906_9PEZI|nr:uncharacterized protein PV09_00342 [Verruconis gallopava]KIW09462.1 hypothetical protein PV09_00342 [Verruconis gallopava]